MANDGMSGTAIRSALLKQLMPERESDLHIGGIRYDELITRYGTPLYVYDARVLRENFDLVRCSFRDRIEVLYALKANPNISVAQVFQKAGSGAEVASSGEIHAALAAKYEGPEIQFAGPGKTPAEIEHAISVGLGCFNIESLPEYRNIASAARRLNKRPGVAIRVNPATGGSGARMRMSGGAKKFGVDSDEVIGLVKTVIEDEAVVFHGLHTYGGTQNFDATAWVDTATSLVDLAGQIERELSIPVTSLDFGGGFGVPYYEGDPTFDIETAGKAVSELIESDGRKDRRYFVELGRYLVATAGVYLTRVTYVKESGGCRHVILDGGMHHHSAAAGVGSIIKRSYPIVSCEAVNHPGEETFSAGGPLCTPADEFTADLTLPQAKAGDVLAVLNSGAYGLTFSNTMFLSHPMPAEVLIDSGTSYLVRTRGKDGDALRGQALVSLEGD